MPLYYDQIIILLYSCILCYEFAMQVYYVSMVLLCHYTTILFTFILLYYSTDGWCSRLCLAAAAAALAARLAPCAFAPAGFQAGARRGKPLGF